MVTAPNVFAKRKLQSSSCISLTKESYSALSVDFTIESLFGKYF